VARIEMSRTATSTGSAFVGRCRIKCILALQDCVELRNRMELGAIGRIREAVRSCAPCNGRSVYRKFSTRIMSLLCVSNCV